MNHEIVASIISKFGGAIHLAAAIQKPYTTVRSWADRGRIPAQHHAEIFSAAQDNNIELSAIDFLRVEQPSSTKPRRRK